MGGPIKKDKLFFFVNYEYLHQTAVLAEQEDLPSVQGLSGIWPEPYHYNLFNTRFDYQINPKNVAFLRYSHDGNEGFRPVCAHSAAGQLQFQLQLVGSGRRGPHHHSLAESGQRRSASSSTTGKTTLTDATQSQCPLSVHRLRASRDRVDDRVEQLREPGPGVNSPQFRQARSGELNETLSWQKGKHRIRFGVDWELHENQDGSVGFLRSGLPVRVFAGGDGVALGPSRCFFPKLPTTITCTQDLLNLPVYNSGSSRSTAASAWATEPSRGSMTTGRGTPTTASSVGVGFLEGHTESDGQLRARL